MDKNIGKKVELIDGKEVVLRKDSKGLYIIKGGVKNYVEYHSYTGTYVMTGEWDHKVK